MFTFEDLNVSPYDCITNVYVIVSDEYYFICDTYFGSYYMKMIKEYLDEPFGVKEFVVFNSHYHWDHIWGNEAFKGSRIIAHKKCLALIEKHGQEDLDSLKKTFAKEAIKLVLPNETFVDKLLCDDIEFFYSPGHSEDSSSCFDHNDKTLFVGDNIDTPIPSFFDWHDLEAYKSTLENYLSYKPERVVQSHGDVMSLDIIVQNIKYLDDLIHERGLDFEDELVSKKHVGNIEFINRLKSVIR